MNYDWDFSVLLDSQYVTVLASGFGLTLLLTVASITIGTPIGFAVGIFVAADSIPPLSGPVRAEKGFSGKAFRIVTLAIVDAIRAIPLLLLILLAYYGLPAVVNSSWVRWTWNWLVENDELRISGFVCCVFAMSVNLSAFVADLVRGAAQGVQRGSVVAARSLGMNAKLTWRRIVLPEIVREIVPGLSLLFITMLKLSTLCSVVAVYELLHSADAIIQKTYKPLEVYVAVAVLFIVVVIPLSALARQFEQSQALRRRS